MCIRDRVWKSLFEMIIPKKYCIEQSVFIIDSYGNISREVDLAVYDEMYTPYIFNYGEIKFIPIEAVAVVVQCKKMCIRDRGEGDGHLLIFLFIQILLICHVSIPLLNCNILQVLLFTLYQTIAKNAS